MLWLLFVLKSLSLNEKPEKEDPEEKEKEKKEIH